jgi:putative membrane protein
MRFVVTAAAATLIAVSAFAQGNGATTQSATPNANATTTNTGAAANQNAPSNPAVKTSEGNNPGAPAPGANSFTEGQAKSRIESRGYANVSGLAKDANGLWRGKAMKDGKAVNVTLDYQGNVTVE